MLRTQLLALALLSITASAQSFNVDIGRQIGSPTPADTYGAASGQAGFWNGVGFDPPAPLVDIHGQLTSAIVWPDFTNCEIDQDNPLTLGDDGNLLDDGHISCQDGTLNWRVSDLIPGTYTVYSYSVAPDVVAFTPMFVDAYLGPNNILPGEGGSQLVTGAWTGEFEFGLHYAVHQVHVPNHFDLRINASGGISNMLSGFQIIRGSGRSYCTGDGTGCTVCPCGNIPAMGLGGGCSNSAGNAAKAIADGFSSLTADSLQFQAEGLPPGAFAILMSAADGLPRVGPCPVGSGIVSPATNGLRCIGGNLRRHGGRQANEFGTIGQTNNGWGLPNGPVGGLVNQGMLAAGGIRQFQIFYRDLPTTGCGTGINTSQAVAITVIP